MNRTGVIYLRRRNVEGLAIRKRGWGIQISSWLIIIAVFMFGFVATTVIGLALTLWGLDQ